MDISAIIDLIMTLLEKCDKKEGRQRTLSRMRSFGNGAGDGELLVRLHLRKQGLKRSEINDVLSELKSAAAMAEDADFTALLDAASHVANEPEPTE